MPTSARRASPLSFVPAVLAAWLAGAAFLVGAAWPAAAARAAEPVHAPALLRSAVLRWMDLAEPSADAPPRVVTLKVVVAKADGLPREAAGAAVDVAYQYPDRLRIAATVAGERHVAGRDGQQLWAHEPGKKFGTVGKAGVRRFAADPDSVDQTVLPPFHLPVSRLKVRALLLLVKAEDAGREKVGDVDCQVIKATLRPSAAELVNAPNLTVHVWLRPADLMPLRVAVADGRADVRVDVTEATVGAAPAPEFWRLTPGADDKVEAVALSHLTKMLAVGPQLMNQAVPTLGPATGSVRLVAKSGGGRLEDRDGTRVLFLRGTPEQMGRQHGALLKAEIRDVSEKILYGIGVGSSFAKGRWFFGEVEEAQARVEKFTDPRVLREMDALADAAGLHRQEGRLANFFPELFHCSGFALLPGATADGHVYHGRVLDYLKGVGLEQNAVVAVHQPSDGRNAWVNLTYAGFVGSVTAMNERGISVGEMGGRGAGNWDGKPMAQLVREVMERAGTLDEAVEIMRVGPRTCEYYYVIADGKTKQAVGIGATPTTFEVVKPGESHPRLNNPSPATVLLSAGDRYDTLSKRVKDGWGSFDATSARELMSRPVCMTSNIQSVLFVPDTLDFYVANADGRSVASQARYTKYNLRELLKVNDSTARGPGDGVIPAK
jgi:isopenicillin-N N-acyltransferase-like protein